jgi:SPP1 gp7 family putative phage head morphogenesis protein
MPVPTRRKLKRDRDGIVLRPVHPNAGIEAAYRRKLDKLIIEMDHSVQYWLKSSYRANEPEMAQDETPAAALQRAMRKLIRRWQRNFDQAAEDLAKYFAKSVSERSDAALRSILKKGGFTVEFNPTPATRDVIQASVAQNVTLIKSIPQRYLTNVEGAVMRSVQAGRDLGSLSKELQAQYGVTRRRAAFIARDQNNKTTAAITRARQNELGLEAKWRHSGGGKHPRPTHVAMDGKTYDPKKGMWDPAVQKWIFPGEEPNCRCISVSIVPGFD